MAKSNDKFWIQPTDGKIAVLHLIREVEDAETPSGTDCSKYHAFCGKTGLSWSSDKLGVPRTHTVPQCTVDPQNVMRCPDCF